MRARQIVYLLLFLGCVGLIGYSILAGDKEGEDSVSSVGGERPKFKDVTYEEALEQVQEALDAGEEVGMEFTRVTGTGWVTAVDVARYGGGKIALDMDGAESDQDGPEVLLEVHGDGLTEKRRPARGAEIRFEGVMGGYEEADGNLIIKLREGEWGVPQ